MMYLIQLFLPLYDENGSAISDQDFAAVRDQLTEKFGGITTYSRAPAKGFWKDRGKVHKDDIVVFEVMAEGLEDNGGIAIEKLSKPGFGRRKS